MLDIKVCRHRLTTGFTVGKSRDVSSQEPRLTLDVCVNEEVLTAGGTFRDVLAHDRKCARIINKTRSWCGPFKALIRSIKPGRQADKK